MFYRERIEGLERAYKNVGLDMCDLRDEITKVSGRLKDVEREFVEEEEPKSGNHLLSDLLFHSYISKHSLVTKVKRQAKEINDLELKLNRLMGYLGVKQVHNSESVTIRKANKGKK